MKKTILTLTCLLASVVVVNAGGIPTTTVGGKTFTFKPSNNVTTTYYVDAATSAQNYTVNAKNTAGNRAYSSSNMTSNIWFQENDAWKGKIVSDAAEVTDAGESTYSGWSSQ